MTSSSNTMSYETRVPSVDRAINVLELVAGARRGLTLSQISQKLLIPKSSAHYLIQGLVGRGYLMRNPGGRDYSLGLCAGSLANTAVARSQLNTVCTPYLQKLVQKLGLIAQVAVLDGAEALIINVNTPANFQLDSWVGHHFDLHCTAVGKALIAHLSDLELERLLQDRGLPMHNPNTVCSLGTLKGHLAETRTRGFATDNEEHALGVRCIAAPVFNPLKKVVAAICTFSSKSNLLNWQIPAIGCELVCAAREISRELGESSSLSAGFSLSQPEQRQ